MHVFEAFATAKAFRHSKSAAAVPANADFVEYTAPLCAVTVAIAVDGLLTNAAAALCVEVMAFTVAAMATERAGMLQLRIFLCKVLLFWIADLF